MNRFFKYFLAFLVCIQLVNGLLKPITTECYFFTTNSSLLCNTSVGIDQCSAKLIGLATEFNLFAIGEIKAMAGKNPYSWFRIHPKKINEAGWWHYKNIKALDTKLSMHSKDKNTPRDDGVLVDDPICWSKLAASIRTSKTLETIRTDLYVKRLFRKYENTKIIGMLHVIS